MGALCTCVAWGQNKLAQRNPGNPYVWDDLDQGVYYITIHNKLSDSYNPFPNVIPTQN